MLDAIVRYTDDAAGLEKTLRLLQSLSTIATGIATQGDDLAFWLKLRSQFALGRRYFRLLKWYPCLSNAMGALSSPQASLRLSLEVLKWTFLGSYFFLEALTITNALGVTNFPWGQTVQRSANECWFFALVASVFLSLYDLAFLNSQRQERSVDRPEDQGKSNSNVTINKDDTQKKKQKNRILTQLTIDAADLFIPGAAVGWIPVSALVVGSASLISTTLAGQQIWTKVQAPRDPSTKVKT